jgi:multiple sugar transport system substrate-binding protein
LGAYVIRADNQHAGRPFDRRGSQEEEAMFTSRDRISRRNVLTAMAGGIAALSLATCGGTAGVAVSATTSATTSASTASTVSTSAGSSTAASVSAASATSTAATSSAAATTAKAETSASTAAKTTAAAIPTPKLNVPPNAKTTLRLTGWGYTPAYGQVYDIYMQQHPDVALTFDQIANLTDYFTKIQTEVAAGDAPDVMTHSTYYYVIYSERQVTRVLDDLVARDKVDLSQFFPASIAGCRWQPGQMAMGQGKLYVFPQNFGTGTVFYFNKTLFDQQGVKYPDASWTWDTWRDTAYKMTRISNGTTQQFGMGTPVDGNDHINSWIWQAGGDFFDPTFTTCTLHSDGKAMDAFTYLVDLVQKTKVAAPSGNMMDLFMKGQLPMASGGAWWPVLISAAKVPSLDYDVFLPPKHPTTGLRTIDVSANGLAITASSKQVDAGWEFIKWWNYGKGVDVVATTISGVTPPYMPAATKYVFNTNRTEAPKSFAIYEELYRTGKPIFREVGAGDIAPILAKGLTAAFTGTQTVDAAATNIASQVTALLNQERAQLGIA